MKSSLITPGLVDAQKFCPPLRKRRWGRILLASLLFILLIIPKMIIWSFPLVVPNMFKSKKHEKRRYYYVG